MTKLYQLKSLWPLLDFKPASLPFLASVDRFGDAEVKFLADHRGMWLFVKDANIDLLDFEAVTGFSKAELEGKKVGDQYVYGMAGGTTPDGARPLLPFPFTGSQLWEFDRRTGGLVYESIDRDEDLRLGDESETERWLADLGSTNPDAAELARAMLLAQPPGLGTLTSHSPAPAVVAVQRATAQELEILNKLRELGLEPKALPRPAPGMPSPAKAAVQKALPNMSPAIFKKAWQRLRNSAQIGEA